MSLLILCIECLLVFGLCLGTYNLAKWRFVKTSLDNVPGPLPPSFVTGNMGQFRGPHSIELQRDLVDNYDSHVVRLRGLLNAPVLYIYDPKALHTILIKDESIWEEVPSFIATNLALFGPGLLSTLGEQHRKQRKMLNPVFSINHMRTITPIFYDTTRRLHDAIESRVKNGPQELDMAGWMGRTALELIGQTGLGYSFDRLVADEKDAFAESLKQMFPIISKLKELALILPHVRQIVPACLRGPLSRVLPISTARDMKYTADFVAQRSQEVFELKKRALQKSDEASAEQVGHGKDIMSILIKANTSASEKDSLTEYELVSQMSTMIMAAMDTTSNTLSRILLLLAEHPDVQQRLRTEIIEASQGEDLAYDALMQLPYLDAVCRESLRLHPPLLWSGRMSTRDTTIPVSKTIPGLDGTPISEFAVPKGTEVIVGVLGCNTSKAFWGEDAMEWKPERWLSPLPDSVTGAGLPAVAGNIMTFLGGKRACIGFKFAEMEMKVVLSVLLPSFVLAPTEKEINWIPAPVWYPVVGQDRSHPRMPLRVAMYTGAA
ncbi:cytochrome P450 monooxygenase [Fomitopsis serialis]|uniref:cytochrome P450 monooxygenase n=1 Tax=Fomitopsis serialis TaxID=139415 RepID=UPI002008AA1D|nr:cytochrome P450 monooxygenase [Neoantrodia serialis]KAH9927308.1 cytochrome P450 monooxygenase [Neoantrodia serialis]